MQDPMGFVMLRPVCSGVGVGACDLLCIMCDFTRCPAASAAQRESSPAKTEAATMHANRLAFSLLLEYSGKGETYPGWVGCGPRTPRRSSMAP